jgi:nitrile hydratase accessory protein
LGPDWSGVQPQAMAPNMKSRLSVASERQNSLENLMHSRAISPDEVVFAEPWQARVFALALELANHGHLDWEDFRTSLSGQIGEIDRGAVGGGGYYQAWLAALEATLCAKLAIDKLEIDQRADEIAANPPSPTQAASYGPVRIA